MTDKIRSLLTGQTYIGSGRALVSVNDETVCFKGEGVGSSLRRLRGDEDRVGEDSVC